MMNNYKQLYNAKDSEGKTVSKIIEGENIIILFSDNSYLKLCFGEYVDVDYNPLTDTDYECVQLGMITYEEWKIARNKKAKEDLRVEYLKEVKRKEKIEKEERRLLKDLKSKYE